MLNNLKIRTKLIGLLLFPVLALLVFASVGWRQRSDTAAQARSDEQIVNAAASATKLASAMSNELAVSTQQAAGTPDPGALKKAQQASDKAFDAFKSENEKVNLSGQGSQVSSAADNLQSFIETTYPGFQADRSTEQDWVSGLTSSSTNKIAPLSDYVRSLATITTTPEVVLPLEQLVAQMDYAREQSVFATLAYGVKAQGNFKPKLPPGVADDGTAETNLKGTIVQQLNTLDVAESVRDAVVGTNSSLATDASKNANVPRGIDLARSDWKGLTTSQLTPPKNPISIDNVTGYIAALGKVATNFTDSTAASIEEHRSTAVRAAQLYVVFASLVVILAVVLAILIATSVTQRLVKLTKAADRLSHEQLPRLVDSLKNPAEEDVGYLTSSFSEIDVSGNDEIGHLAGAYNRIQGVAVQVATEQAQLLRKGIGDMFVNLARRNQGLLDRQIEFIDQLESAEEDPDQLENLFRLDHLATRMRRNAESLLVLAGAEPNRRRGKPVPLADVVRAAVGEVEDFARIDMLQFDEVLVASNAALDIAHLLSELMENAANFSPPDTRVEVVGHRTKAEGYVISVTDHGIGMAPEALAESNDLLARPPLVGLALSCSLGFIVIGRLAARFGIAVRLMPSPTTGTTAMVSLPPSLITDQPRTSTDPAAITDTAPTQPATAKSSDPDALAKGTDRRPPVRRGEPAKPKATAPKPTPTSRPKTAKPGGGAPPKRVPGAARAGSASAAQTAAPTDAAAATAPAQPAATAATGPTATTGGLTKRVPRAAGGKRAVPGGDGQRSATQNRRSPEEVRSMLSNYRSGMQKGRSDDDPTKTPEDTGK